MIELRHVPIPEAVESVFYMLHRPTPNRVYVEPIDQHISGTTVMVDGHERRVLSVSRATYQSTGEIMIVTLKPLPRARRLQCKDLSEHIILSFLARFSDSEWKSWWANTSRNDWGDWSIANQFPEINQCNERVLLRKMSRLIKRGYVDGCDCGCRGDFYITANGRTRLQQLERQHAGI